MTVKRHKQNKYERYPFENSPWTQDLAQRDLAELLGWKKQQLEALVRDKDRYIKRGPKLIGTKTRELAVPTGKLRTIHERIKIHLNKIKQPEYLFSPRKGRAQRDNAEHHVGQNQILSLDIKQFYPSTTDEHIFRWAYHVAGLRADVAGLFTKLVAVDGKMPFGSPVSPVLTTLVHRQMFDAISDICKEQDLKMSLWVDDLVISGSFVRGKVMEDVRAAIRRFGFQTHKIQFRSTARPVPITGVPVTKTSIGAPLSLHRRIQSGYAELRQRLTDAQRTQATDKLLAALGTYRYHLGASSEQGRLAANRMNALRMRRARLKPRYVTYPVGSTPDETSTEIDDGTPPWE
ncbi:reverse transcriptase family protein [Sphingopyxis sp. USTB-05]|uniref:reverse transcriptase family protein n=1 Tax=Sphingopyxis sp. USTB-05 TaxID=2830667 RepID=UPI002078DA00|nr:reverse transcriptase family protein [Sphingopyxis sp. USTB-05]USI75531.1 reverse transcriptase family protein [Sphingopyxis sp. USTB-05]